MKKVQGVALSKEEHRIVHQNLIKVDRYDLFLLLDYIILLGEKKDCAESGCPKNHIWYTAKRIMKAVNYKE